MKTTARTTSLDTLTCVHPNAAGLDIGSREIWASVPPDRDPEPVRRFGTFTPDLERLVDWLIQCGIDTVALETFGRRVLDPGVRAARSARRASRLGRAAAAQAGARAKVGLARLPMDAEAA